MPSADRFYVVEYRNPEADNHPHYVTRQLDERYSHKESLRHWLTGHSHLVVDIDREWPWFATKAEADAEGRRLGEIANAADPDRVSATAQFPPGEANRHLEVGKPGATPPE